MFPGGVLYPLSDAGLRGAAPRDVKNPPATFDSSWPFTSPNSTFPFGDSVNGEHSGYENLTVFTGGKKSPVMIPLTVQTPVVQASTLFVCKADSLIENFREG